MYALKNSIHKVYKDAAEAVLPVRSQSRFREEGVLTPEEFVEAGAFLVRTCPSWSWEGGDPKKSQPHLPKDKQYLVTRKVPCHRRAVAVEGLDSVAEKLVEVDAEGDGWVSTAETGHAADQETGIPDLDEAPARQQPGSVSQLVNTADDDVPDIDDLAIEEEDDEAAVPRNGYLVAEEPEDHVVRTRTYDLYITYDKYYSVPKFWLVGYSESEQPLPAKQVLEDVSEDYARKTVTVENFPHYKSVTAASIHPCKHAVTMKKLSSMMESDGKTFPVDRYMVLFLKFISSVVPTIEYDYTMSVSL